MAFFETFEVPGVLLLLPLVFFVGGATVWLVRRPPGARPSLVATVLLYAAAVLLSFVSILVIGWLAAIITVMNS